MKEESRWGMLMMEKTANSTFRDPKLTKYVLTAFFIVLTGLNTVNKARIFITALL